MKILSFACFLLHLTVFSIVPFTVLGQKKVQMELSDLPISIDTVTGDWKYVYVGEVSGAKADVLYERAKSWLVDSFKSAKTVIDYDDKTGGTLVAKPIITVSIKPRGLLRINQELYKASIDLRVKDGKYRCELQILEGVPSDAERRASALVANYPIQFTTMSWIKMIRKKGVLYSETYDQMTNLDEQFRNFLAVIDKAMSSPSKSEF